MKKKESKWKKIVLGIIFGILALIVLFYVGLALTR